MCVSRQLQSNQPNPLKSQSYAIYALRARCFVIRRIHHIDSVVCWLRSYHSSLRNANGTVGEFFAEIVFCSFIVSLTNQQDGIFWNCVRCGIRQPSAIAHICMKKSSRRSDRVVREKKREGARLPVYLQQLLLRSHIHRVCKNRIQHSTNKIKNYIYIDKMKWFVYEKANL